MCTEGRVNPVIGVRKQLKRFLLDKEEPVFVLIVRVGNKYRKIIYCCLMIAVCDENHQKLPTITVLCYIEAGKFLHLVIWGSVSQTLTLSLCLKIQTALHPVQISMGGELYIDALGGQQI